MRVAVGLRAGIALAAAAAAATWDPVESAVILALLAPPGPRFASAVAAISFSAYRLRVLPCFLAHLFPSRPSALGAAAGAAVGAALWYPLWHAPVAAALACVAAGGLAIGEGPGSPSSSSAAAGGARGPSPRPAAFGRADPRPRCVV